MKTSTGVALVCLFGLSMLLGGCRIGSVLVTEADDGAALVQEVGDLITVRLDARDAGLVLSVHNPGPPLPERMRSQLFDSMVSVRTDGNDKHLGLGLYVAKLIAEGHGGRITAENTDGGVRFSLVLPVADAKLVQVGRE